MRKAFKLKVCCPHPLLENVDYFTQMLRQYIPLHNVRGSIHYFVLVRQLGVDTTRRTVSTTKKHRNEKGRTLYNE